VTDDRRGKGGLFITLKGETEVANLIVWPSLLEQQRRVVLSASLLACRGRVQCEGEVIHLIAEHLIDLSDLLRTVSATRSFPLPNERGDEAKHGRAGPAVTFLSNEVKELGQVRGRSFSDQPG
jgi:error-prone DNA polymerase